MKEVYKLDRWAIVYAESPYTAPELRSQSLYGYRDGKPVKTSRVLGKSGNCVVTQNSLYMLGDPQPEYEAVYPNAKQRLFDSLIEVNE
jgi:hypothetical protein